MTLVRPIRAFVAHAREQRGSVVAFVAVGLMALLAVFAIVIDVGNWYLHRRALQNQVDAAALAGGALFGYCFVTGATPATAMANMIGVAKNYSGDPTASPNYNPQIGDAKTKGDIWVGYNSQVYLSNPGPTATGLTDNLSNPLNNPCAPDFIFDVKETDSNLALIMHGFLPGFGKLGHVQARARVQLKQEIISTGSMPLAVANVNPNTVSATFVDETTGAALTGCSMAGCVFPLTKSGPSGSPPLTMWGGDATIPAPTAGQKIGVRIGLAYATRGCAGTDGGDGYICFDNLNNNQGLVALRGVSAGAGTAAAPKLNAVWPTTICSGSPFFSDYQAGTGCGAGVQAQVDFGTGTNNPTLPASSGGVGAHLFATVNGTRVEFTSYDNATKIWSTAGNAWTLPDGLGPLNVTMDWEEHSGTLSGKDCSKTPLPTACKGNLPDTGGFAQQLYSGSPANSDPVKVLSLSEAGAINPGAPYSLGSGSHTVHVTVGLQGSLQISSSPVLLRGLGGSRTTAVRCYPGGGTAAFKAAIINGCPNEFQLNDWQAGDPDPGLCTGTDPTTADPTPPPNNTVTPDCIALEPGGFGNPTADALNVRYASCPANHYGEAGYVYDPAVDKRVVQLMVTDFSYLSGSGRVPIPVVDFGEFYITGWGGSTCGSPPNQPWPFAGSPQRGDVWGYFIKTVINDPGHGGPSPCDPNRITPCVPVMTR